MLDQHTVLLFLPAMLAITFVPGADTLFVVSSAVRTGSRGGILAACGITCGGTVHIGLATIGLSTLILKSALAFTALKYAGAAYLIYIGIRSCISKDNAVRDEPVSATERSASALFVQGFMTNVLNPKVALFVVAFFPQFVSTARGPVWLQMLELGALWYAAGLLWLGALGAIVGRARRSATPSAVVRKAFKYVTGSIFIGLGIRVALPDHR